MGIGALHVARTGLDAQNFRMQVIANNLANVNTTGFKRDRANFETLAYQAMLTPGVLYSGEILNADDVDLLLTNAAPPLESRRERVAVAPVSFVPAALAPCKDQPIDLRQEIEAIELERINMALELADGIVSEAARLLTLKRTTLIEKMRKYGVQAVA